MFQKLTMFLFTIMLVFGLAACGGSNSQSKGQDHKTTQTGKGSSSAKKAQPGKPTAPKTKGLVSKKKTVAVVNGEKIKGDKYNAVLKKMEMQYQQRGQNPTQGKLYQQVKKQAMDTVVGQTLLLQDADKKGYQPSDKKVNQQFDKFAKQFGGKKKFKKLLDKQNMTLGQYKKNMKKQIELNTYIRKEVPVKVTDSEIKAAYQQYKASAKHPKKLDTLKPAIKSQLKQQKQGQKIAKIIDQLKKEGNIQVKI
ncbi:MAG TPA: SurA N-terminal domain-containing protein [Bacillales bacterium]|nr:SurA N-terminal domain-containing protein [Bacillales bacterium]